MQQTEETHKAEYAKKKKTKAQQFLFQTCSSSVLIFIPIAVYILFEGEAKVRWEEHRTRTRNGKSESYTEYFRGTETYLNSRTNVFGEGELPAGVHTYTFLIPLPLECPTSCVEKYGKISYEVSLVLDRSWRFNNVFKQPITVLQTYNLNMYPEMLVSQKVFYAYLA